MPKVSKKLTAKKSVPTKRKATTKKTTKKAAKKATKKTAKTLTAERSWIPNDSHFSGIMRRVGIAGGLGVGFVVLLAVGMLWASGVFGRLGEDVARNTQNFTAQMMVDAGFEVHKVNVIGRHKTPSEALINALGPVAGTSLMHFNPHTARARIEQLGWVRSVAVSRLWPNQITVSIREREPAALWQVNGSFRLVDQEGAIIREVGSNEFHNLPYIVGVGAPEVAADFLEVIDEVGVFEDRIAALMRVKGRRWTLRLHTKSGKLMDIKLPETDFQQAVRDLAVLDEAVSVLDRDFEYIDLRDPERAFFRCHGAKSKDGPALNVLSGDYKCSG